VTPRAATPGAFLRQELEPLIAREISGITAIDTAVAHGPSPDYVVMFQSARSGKQANVEQLATLVRMHGGSPDESGGLRKALTRTQAAISSRLSITMALRTMRLAEIELVTLYSAALGRSDGLFKRALTKALSRALVHTHLLTAHLAKRSGGRTDADLLPAPLDAYFAGPEARACMRCHLDRPGIAGPLEWRDPHPYTYICAACHDEVPGEFPPDLAAQMDRWPRQVQEAKVIQHAIGRVSKLNAMGRVLHPLAGIEPELPPPAAARAFILPVMAPTPGPAPGERRGEVDIAMAEGPEGDYIRMLFSPERVWHNW
jgi:hypothetical protein